MWNEAKDQQQKREKREEQAFGIKRSEIANGGSRKETKAKQDRRPDIPTRGMAEKSKKHKTRRQNQRNDAMSAGIDGTENMSTVELAHRQQIKRRGKQAGPGGASNGMEKHIVGRDTGMNQRSQRVQQPGNTKDGVKLMYV